MASIAKLVVSLGANIAGFETDMARANRNQQRRMKQLEREAQAAGKAIAVAFAGVAASMTAVVLKTTQTADGMQKMADRLGTSTEALSELAHVADLSGVQFNQLTIGMQRMERRIAEVASLGKGEAKQALEQLGLSAKELAALPVDKQFERVAEELSKVGVQSEKVRLAFKLFDSEGVALVQTMGEGAAGIQAMREEARQLGLTISGEFAARSEAFNDNLTRMGALATGAARTFTNALLPALLDIQTGFLQMDRDMDVFAETGETVGKVLKTMTTAFVIAKEAALVFGRVLLGSVIAVFNAFRAVASPVTGLVTSLAEAFQRLAERDFSGALDAIQEIPSRIADEFAAAAKEIETAGGFITEQFNDAIPEALERVNRFFNATAQEIKKTETAMHGVVRPVIDFNKETKDAEKRVKTIRAEFEKWSKELDAIGKEQEQFNDQLQELRDIADPVGALVRRFEFDQSLLNRAIREGRISSDEYQRILNILSARLGQAAAETKDLKKETDIWTEAMLEGVRILERSFTSAWESIIDGSENAFEGILDGFKTLLANMLHQLTTAPLLKELEKIFKGEVGIGGLDFGKVIQSIAGVGGVGLGSILGGGGTGAAIGAGLGTLVGTLLTASAGPIGAALGKVFGGIAGGLLGGLFDDKPDLELQLVGAGLIGSPVLQGRNGPFTGTALGGFFTTNTGDLDASQVQQFVNALVEFDNAFASFLNDNQIGEVTELLKQFGIELDGDALTVEGFIGERLRVIQFALDQSVLGFVKAAKNLEDEANRTGVAFLTDTLFGERPDLFTGRTQAEFLKVVEAFQDGTETITDAFNEVLQILDAVVSITEALKDFSGSDVVADFEALLALQNETPLQALTRLSDALSDAVFNFSGDPASLAEIGNLVQQVRQGEIQLLTQIDQIQRGINKSLERLKEDVLTIIEGPQSAEEILAEATALIDAVSQASTVEEIADLSAQFESLIRSLSEDDIAGMGDAVLALIDSFQTAANTALEAAKQAAIDNAESLRELVGTFLEEIGDPLSIIAASNEKAAAALETIASGASGNITEAFTDNPNWPYEQAEIISVDINETLTEGLEDQSRVLQEGTDSMSRALGAGVASMANQLERAISSGFSGVDINVNVTVDASDLVTE